MQDFHSFYNSKIDFKKLNCRIPCKAKMIQLGMLFLYIIACKKRENSPAS